MSELMVRKGEKVTCENGHVICECMADVYEDTLNWANNFGNFTQKEPYPGQVDVPPCERCGAIWIKCGIGIFPAQMHFEDGTWRP